ncbi:restriction endonuclease subunit S [Flavobacterium piscinae]|uniref:restriction endonuclease subunit S n=1 Tax=Flavobacterium piscinae TaxID=2506424 RepID=UPI0019A75483|nr:restriction endonuclease subunit S [Flavobacterium piscinae]MBC8883332.1 restriction endonuclease subunit S [Flavobacterium piscinae]
MEGFSLSNNADKNKVFLVNQSNLEGRFDSYFYKYDFQLMIQSLNNSKFETVPFKKIIKSINNGFDFRDYKDDGIPYIKVANVKQGEFDFNKIQYIDFSSEEITKNIQLKKGNILLTRKGTYGNALSLDKEYNYVISSEVFYIELKTDLIDSKYLEIFFNSNIGQKQFNRVSIGAIMGSLSQEALKTLKIPLPPKHIQKEIIDLYQTAYTQKQQKEAQAKQTLLASIDTYLLNELGITLPEKDTSLQSRIFTTMFSEVSGGRFDVFAIINKDYRIDGGKYPNKRLKKIASLDKGQSITSENIIEGEYPVIAGGQTSPYNHNVFNYQGNVITISASGAYSGYVWYHTTPIFASDCTVIQSKNEKEVTTIYLSEILKTKQKEIYHLQQGAGQPHVYAKDLEKLNIPLPPPEKQTEITNFIQAIRTQAKQLQEEAKLVLEEAKRE